MEYLKPVLSLAGNAAALVLGGSLDGKDTIPHAANNTQPEGDFGAMGLDE